MPTLLLTPLTLPRQRGFTLLEMLVVLLIVALAGSLLFEGSAQVLGMQARLEAQLSAQRDTAMRADWLRQLVQGLQPDYQDGRHLFLGTAQGYSGLSTNLLAGDYGSLAPFSIVLSYQANRDETLVRYGSTAEAPVLLTLSGTRTQLRYWDDQGEAHDSWPPAMGLWPQLPRAITLEGRAADQPLVIAASPYGPILPTPRPRDVMGGM